MRVVFRRRRGAWPAQLAFVLAVTLFAVSATAASIAERAAPLRLCLDGQFEKWVASRAELAVNEDPRMGDIDDAAVARWASGALDACRLQAGGGEKEAEALFIKRASQWRQHIYDRVQSIRELARPD